MNKSEQVYQYLRREIIEGRLQPGDPVKYSNIAKVLPVSKIPFREALKKLETLGMVEIIHNSGAKVKKLNLDVLEQIVLIRLELEVMVAGMAAEKITAETLEKLWKMVEAMDELVAKDQKDEYSELNRQFHMTLYSASQADFIVNMIKDLWDQSEKTTTVFKSLPARFHASNGEHKEMLKYLEQHDREGVKAVLRHQKENGFINIIRILKEYGA